MASRLTPRFNGAKLTALRARRGLTQQDLSDLTAIAGRRIDRATISRYENGESTPTALNFAVIVAALNCQDGDLLDDEVIAA